MNLLLLNFIFLMCNKRSRETEDTGLSFKTLKYFLQLCKYKKKIHIYFVRSLRISLVSNLSLLAIEKILFSLRKEREIIVYFNIKIYLSYIYIYIYYI